MKNPAMNRQRWIVGLIAPLVFLFLFVADSFANEVELNGFLLLQYRDAVQNTLGKPFNTGETEQTEYEAYSIGDNAYMVFEFLKDRPDWVHSIQVSGAKANMRPFHGLTLGDSREKVVGKLGKPDNVEKVKDGKKELLRYGSKNCSVELDARGVLVSIRIYSHKDILAVPDDDNGKNWTAFRKAVMEKDRAHIADFFRPDAEIFKGLKILSIDRQFYEFFKDQKGEFFNALFSDSDSVYSELKKTEPEMEYRLHEKMGFGFVHKFYKSKVLQEIYFLPYAGRWRIYEIKFAEE